MIRKSLLWICILALVPIGYSYGQSFSATYGEGVHQFFNGQHQQAIQTFDSAIAENYKDPRPYYFRGLARLRSGDSFAAESDFMMGAQMEASTKRRSSLVGRSLERIQGGDRQLIERARFNAFNPGSTTTSAPYPMDQVVDYGSPSPIFSVVPESIESNIVTPSSIVYEQPIYSQTIYSQPVYNQPFYGGAVTLAPGCGTSTGVIVDQGSITLPMGEPSSVAAESVPSSGVQTSPSGIVTPPESTITNSQPAQSETPAAGNVFDGVDEKATPKEVDSPFGGAAQPVAEPEMKQPLAQDPFAQEPLANEAASEPFGQEPADSEPVADPVGNESVGSSPETNDSPFGAEPTAVEPAPIEPAAEPLAAEPLAAEPLAAEPLAAEPVVTEPTTTEPVTEPAAENPLREMTADPAPAEGNDSPFGAAEPVKDASDPLADAVSNDAPNPVEESSDPLAESDSSAADPLADQPAIEPTENLDSPFGETPAADELESEDQPVDGDSPFGEAQATETPADETPADVNDDPFG